MTDDPSTDPTEWPTDPQPGPTDRPAPAESTDRSEPADSGELTDDLEALVAEHPQLEELAEGLSGLDTVSAEQQHDRLASADEKLRAILDDGPRPSVP